MNEWRFLFVFEVCIKLGAEWLTIIPYPFGIWHMTHFLYMIINVNKCTIALGRKCWDREQDSRKKNKQNKSIEGMHCGATDERNGEKKKNTSYSQCQIWLLSWQQRNKLQKVNGSIHIVHRTRIANAWCLRFILFWYHKQFLYIHLSIFIFTFDRQLLEMGSIGLIIERALIGRFIFVNTNTQARMMRLNLSVFLFHFRVNAISGTFDL